MPKRLMIAFATTVLMLALAACTNEDDDKPRIKIGVSFDQPGLGLKKLDGSLEGFDIDMATYVAKGLGYDEDQIEWVQTVSATRESYLESGAVDMVVSTYSITDRRKERVDFAGPYFEAAQDIMVLSEEREIVGVESLNDRRLCSVIGSLSAERVRYEYATETKLVDRDSYSQCVDALLEGDVDAMTTDNVILVGYLVEHPGRLKLLGTRIAEEPYGIGLPKGSPRRDKVNDLIERSFEDGSWAKSLERNLGKSGYPLPETPTIDRY